jgi:uncharacterized protein YndB with AHSA1/START domain
MSYELSIERLIDAPVDAVWKAYTDHLEEWFCPRPWTVEIVAQELRPGGRSALIMRGPNGEGGEVQDGVYLEVIPGRKLVFTDAFKPGWEPAGPFMVGSFEFEPEGDKTRYRATARHWTQEAMERHDAMGFQEGWGTVAAQLEEVAQRVARDA